MRSILCISVFLDYLFDPLNFKPFSSQNENEMIILYTHISIDRQLLLFLLTCSFWAYLGLFFFFEGDKQVLGPQIESVVIPQGGHQVQWEILKNCPVVLQQLNILLHKLAFVVHIGARRKLITTFACVCIFYVHLCLLYVKRSHVRD